MSVTNPSAYENWEGVSLQSEKKNNIRACGDDSLVTHISHYYNSVLAIMKNSAT